MASSSKKPNRQGAKPAQPRLAAAAVEASASDISTAALQAAEVLPPVDEAAHLSVENLEVPAVGAEDAPLAEIVAASAAASVASVEVAAAESEAPPPDVYMTLSEAPAVESFEAPVAQAQDVAVAEISAATSPLVAAAELAAPAAERAGDNIRALADKSLSASRGGFAEVKTAAQEASAAVEASCDAARDGMVALNLKAIEAMKAGALANFELAMSFASAKTLSELLTLQGEYARRHIELTASQTQTMAELARKVADETMAPFKAHIARTFKIAV